MRYESYEAKKDLYWQDDPTGKRHYEWGERVRVPRGTEIPEGMRVTPCVARPAVLRRTPEQREAEVREKARLRERLQAMGVKPVPHGNTSVTRLRALVAKHEAIQGAA